MTMPTCGITPTSIPTQFKFDSGDQEPGSKTSVKFPVAGTFDVLCAIHPKMKLTVHVK